MKESARIDKWLWAARIYKTRSIAADACKNGRVTVGGVTRKPSFIIKRGDVVSVKKAPITYSFEVLDCIEQRVGAKMLEQEALVAQPRKNAVPWMPSLIQPCLDSMKKTGTKKIHK